VDEHVYRLDEARRAAADAREKLEQQNQQLSDLEAEVGLLRRRVEQLETDRDKDKKLIAQLQESLNRARAVCLFILAFSCRPCMRPRSLSHSLWRLNMATTPNFFYLS